MIDKTLKKLIFLFISLLFLGGLGISFLLWDILKYTSWYLPVLKLFWCLIGGALILFVIFFVLITQQINKLLLSIDYLFQSVLSKKPIQHLDPSVDNRFSKITHQAHQIIHMLRLDAEKIGSEKDNLQSLISDISHQVKTPLSNLELYNTLLLEMELTPEERHEFLIQIHTQIDKLKWLMHALVKVSRMESGIIQLAFSKNSLKQIIASAISSIYEQASYKNIEILLQMEQDLLIDCDKKWTTEAFFNVLDNAVKYSFTNTTLTVQVIPLELYTQINITNQGLPLSPDELPRLFKRFYRSPQAVHIEGSGIGLHLTKVILEKQSGYIKVSCHDSLTTFSIFMYNHLPKLAQEV